MKIADYDEIVVLTCDKHKYRLPFVVDECERLGLTKHEGFVISSRGPTGQHNVAHVFENALKYNAHRVLVLENDVRFLKDADSAIRILESAPTMTTDGVFFDIFPQWGKPMLEHIKKRREEGVAFVGMMPMTFGASCYSVGQKYMAAFLETFALNPDQPPDSALHTMNPKLTNVFSTRSPCVQALYVDANNLRWNDIQHVCYRDWGIDYSLYNFETDYKFGDVLPVGGAK